MSPFASEVGPEGSTRREFGAAVALWATAPLAGIAQEPKTEPKPPPEPAPAHLLAEVLRLRYGKYLTADQLKEVEKAVEGNLRLANFLLRFNLKNGDEPDVVFQPAQP